VYKEDRAQNCDPGRSHSERCQ